MAWPVGSERYDRRVAIALEVVSRSVCSQTRVTGGRSADTDPGVLDPEQLASTAPDPNNTENPLVIPTRRPEKSKLKSRIKNAVIAIGSIVLALFALAVTWIGVSIYRIDHAIHHVAVPASLISKRHDDLLLVVKGPNNSEQVLVVHSVRGHTGVLQIPKTLMLPVGRGQTARIDALSVKRPATIMSGLERLGIPIGQFVGLDLHMYSTHSVIGRLAMGQVSASSLISNPLSASSVLEQVASHIYLGPGTPTSAVMSLATVSAAHAVAIPTTRDSQGRIVLAANFSSISERLQ
jgi:hypothetical protein